MSVPDRGRSVEIDHPLAVLLPLLLQLAAMDRERVAELIALAKKNS